MIISLIAEIYLIIAESKKNENQDYIEKYYKELNKGNHLTPQKLTEFSIKQNYCKNKDENFFKRKEYRNAIAHANIYYDEFDDSIYLKGDLNQYKLDQFLNEFKYSSDFLKQIFLNLTKDYLNFKKEFKKYF